MCKVTLRNIYNNTCKMLIVHKAMPFMLYIFLWKLNVIKISDT